MPGTREELTADTVALHASRCNRSRSMTCKGQPCKTQSPKMPGAREELTADTVALHASRCNRSRSMTCKGQPCKTQSPKMPGAREELTADTVALHAPRCNRSRSMICKGHAQPPACAANRRKTRRSTCATPENNAQSTQTRRIHRPSVASDLSRTVRWNHRSYKTP